MAITFHLRRRRGSDVDKQVPLAPSGVTFGRVALQIAIAATVVPWALLTRHLPPGDADD